MGTGTDVSEWDDFENRLGAALRQVTDRVFLIVASQDAPLKYVQFAATAELLDAQAPGIDVVVAAKEAALSGAGWAPPSDLEPNWTSPLPRPALSAEYAALAARCVVALRDAFGVESPFQLAYRAWREAEQMPPGVTYNQAQLRRLDPGESGLELPALALGTF